MPATGDSPFTTGQLCAFDSVISGWETALKSSQDVKSQPACATASHPGSCTSSSSQLSDVCPRRKTLLDLPSDVLALVAHHVAAPPLPRTASVNNPPLGYVVRRKSSWDTSGLQDVLRLGMTCRQLQNVRQRLLIERTDLRQQVEKNSHIHREKTKIVRKLSLTHSPPLSHSEVAVQVLVAALWTSLWFLTCSLHSLCGSASVLLQATVTAVLHLCVHSLVLGYAYRCCARLGTYRTLALGLAPVVVLYLGLAVYGDKGLMWKAIPLAIHCVTWVYGAWEYVSMYGYLKTCNGLK